MDAPVDLVANRTDDLEVLPRGILELPVDVLLARDHGTRVATAHRDNDVRPLRVGLVELLRNPVGELGHQLHHFRMNVLRRCRPRGARTAAALLVEGLSYLRPARVLPADEEDVHAPSAPLSASIVSGTIR